jgi:large subunit ribosomal protein L15
MTILSNLRPPRGAKRNRFRVGRGVGSGNGKTAGRGQKGQKARTYRGKTMFEGGQMPLVRRIPKRGFFNVHAPVTRSINVGQLDAFDDGAVVTIDALRERRLVQGRFDRVKILGDGELGKKLTVQAHAFSAGALRKIERAGGKAELLAPEPATGSAAEQGD